MNMKRFLGAAIVLFGFIFAYEWVVHGMLLTQIYESTASVWRPHEQMVSFFPMNILLIGVVAFWLTFIFTRFYPEGGCGQGIQFGIYVGILSGIQAFAAFFYLPIPAVLAGYWFVASAIECIMGGLLIGLIYKK
mgnify:CR=1 FL=1